MKMIAINLIFVPLLIINVACVQIFPHIIWLYWDTGQETLTGFEKICFEKMKQIHKQTDWQIRLVSKNTVKDWMNKANYQRYMYHVGGKQQFMTQTKADMIRFYLLKEHGGVWMDISIILKQNLNWLDELQNNPYVLHRHIFQKPQIFIHYNNFQNFKFNIQQQRKININGYDYYPLILVQNAFIGAVPQSPFLNDVIEQFQKVLIYMENRYLYFKREYGIPNDWNPYFANFRSISICLYRKYVQYQQLKIRNQDIQELDQHFYKILIMSRQVGMYYGSLNNTRITETLFTQEAYSDQKRNLIKISHGASRQVVLDFIINNNQTAKQQQEKLIHPQVYHLGQHILRQQYNCLYKLMIHEFSALDKYLFSNKQLASKYYPNVQIVKKSQNPFICRLTSLNSAKNAYPILCQWFELSIFLFLFVEIACKYYFLYIKKAEQYFKYQKSVENALKKMIFYLTITFLHKDLIKFQYELWLQSSPDAIFLILVQCICVLLFLKDFIQISFKQPKSYRFIAKIIVILLVQYYFVYYWVIWNYKGAIYKYQIVKRITKLKHVELHNQMMKVFILISAYLIIDCLKWIFVKDQFFSNNQLQNQYSQNQNIILNINQVKFKQNRINQNENENYLGSYLSISDREI